MEDDEVASEWGMLDQDDAFIDLTADQDGGSSSGGGGSGAVDSKMNGKGGAAPAVSKAADDLGDAFQCDYCRRFRGRTYDELMDHMGMCDAL